MESARAPTPASVEESAFAPAVGAVSTAVLTGIVSIALVVTALVVTVLVSVDVVTVACPELAV
ncbi:MAG TPA: hypothetical protein VGO31_09955 [Microbacteriaceae bacterium]|nr:hypothetical protein [Microbacteriaceae bacterium]